MTGGWMCLSPHALLLIATGVEFAGTLSDYVRLDLKRKYPQVVEGG